MKAADLAAEAAERMAQARSMGTSDPMDGARPSWACSAAGCPLPGAIGSGGADRQCYLHFGLGMGHASRVSSWLRNRPAIVAALRVHDGATHDQMRAIGAKLRAAGLEAWAPRQVTLEHEGYGRHGEGLKVPVDELGAPKVYRQRVRGMVDAEIAQMLRQKDLAA